MIRAAVGDLGLEVVFVKLDGTAGGIRDEREQQKHAHGSMGVGERRIEGLREI